MLFHLHILLLVVFLRSSKEEHEPDEELILKFRNSGENSYIGVLFQRYTHLVFGVCMKYLKNEEDSKDAVMDIFEKTITDLRKHKVENFKAWLYFVAKNHCLMKLRKEKTILSRKTGYEKFVKEVVEFGDDLHLNNAAATPEDMEHCLRTGIGYLKEEQKHCINLFYFEDKSYQEIADMTGYSLKQVKSFLQNGKRNLKLRLKHRYE